MSIPKNYLHEINQVVVVMFENRSFDNLLGWMYEQSDHAKLKFIPVTRDEPFEGLDGKILSNKFSSSFNDPKAYPVVKGTTPYAGKDGDSAFTVPDLDPHEPFQYVWQQLWGPDVIPPKSGSTVNSKIGQTAPMSGFLADYASVAKYNGGDSVQEQENKAITLKILETYTSEQAPVINTLAKWYGVSDEWYSSIPSQTNCNRAFAGAGTSQGLVNNHWNYTTTPVAWKTDTIWNVMMDQGKLTNNDWKIYYSQLWSGVPFDRYSFTIDMFHKLYEAMEDSNMQKMNQFHNDAANGTLPAFSFLEPTWYTAGLLQGTPSSYHPPSDISNAEFFLKEVFESLTTTETAKEKWRDTLLVIYFDEHGGCYDHVSPPNCIPPGDMGSPPTPPDYTFDFKTLGCRVPAILASPRIQKHTVFRSDKVAEGHHIDHCSLIATLLKWKGINPATAGMGARVVCAPTFEDVFTLDSKQARVDLPDFGNVRPARLTEAEAGSSETPHNLTEEHFSQIGQVLSFVTKRKVNGQILTNEINLLRKAKTKGEIKTALAAFDQKFLHHQIVKNSFRQKVMVLLQRLFPFLYK